MTINPHPCAKAAIDSIGRAVLDAALDAGEFDADILAGQLAAVIGLASEAAGESPLTLIEVVDAALAELIAEPDDDLCPLPWLHARQLLAAAAAHFRTH